jgi:hypothetical protein
MSAPRTPFMEQVLDATIPPLARWVVALMSRMEEATLDPTARWDLLRQRLRQLGKQGEQP